MMSKRSIPLILIAIAGGATLANGDNKSIETRKIDNLTVSIKNLSQGAAFAPDEKIECEVELSMPKGHSKPVHVIVHLLTKDGKSIYWDRFCDFKDEKPDGTFRYQMQSWRMPDRLIEYDLVARATFLERPDPKAPRPDIYRVESAKVALVVGRGKFLAPAKATQKDVNLMQILEAWKYPGSTHQGASMGDGGDPNIKDVHCMAVLTTPDPFEDVVRFYARKNATDPKTRLTSTRDDSAGRPMKFQLITVQGTETTTTLVINRADGEKETHIAWAHYMWFSPR
jgi:hypothetical protein